MGEQRNTARVSRRRFIELSSLSALALACGAAPTAAGPAAVPVPSTSAKVTPATTAIAAPTMTHGNALLRGGADEWPSGVAITIVWFCGTFGTVGGAVG